jgi:hypothetical protein
MCQGTLPGASAAALREMNSACASPALACGDEYRVQRDLFRAGGAMLTILIVVLVLLLVGALPTWPYSGGWGYYPSGGLGLIVLILVLLLLTGRI